MWKVGLIGFLFRGRGDRMAYDSHFRIRAFAAFAFARGDRRLCRADHPVRFIDAVVDGLDLKAAGFWRVEAKATGRFRAFQEAHGEVGSGFLGGIGERQSSHHHATGDLQSAAVSTQSATFPRDGLCPIA